jgi:hypothetical protein
MFILILSVSACSNERWDGYIFPDREKTLVQHHVGTFSSKEECEKASMEMLKARRATDTGFCECGKNCETAGSYYSRGCEETARYNMYQ